MWKFVKLTTEAGAHYPVTFYKGNDLQPWLVHVRQVEAILGKRDMLRKTEAIRAVKIRVPMTRPAGVPKEWPGSGLVANFAPVERVHLELTCTVENAKRYSRGVVVSTLATLHQLLRNPDLAETSPTMNIIWADPVPTAAAPTTATKSPEMPAVSGLDVEWRPVTPPVQSSVAGAPVVPLSEICVVSGVSLENMTLFLAFTANTRNDIAKKGAEFARCGTAGEPGVVTSTLRQFVSNYPWPKFANMAALEQLVVKHMAGTEKKPGTEAPEAPVVAPSVSAKAFTESVKREARKTAAVTAPEPSMAFGNVEGITKANFDLNQTKQKEKEEVKDDADIVDVNYEEVFTGEVETKEIKVLTFDDVSIDSITQDDKHWIAVNPICQALGIDPWTQISRLKRDSRYHYRHMLVGPVGKRRGMFFLDLKNIHTWLNSINANKVAEGIRPRLVKYQAEMEDTFNRYFNQGFAINPRVGDTNAVAKLTEMLMSAIARLDQAADTTKQLTGEVTAGKTKIAHLETDLGHTLAKNHQLADQAAILGRDLELVENFAVQAETLRQQAQSALNQVAPMVQAICGDGSEHNTMDISERLKGEGIYMGACKIHEFLVARGILECRKGTDGHMQSYNIWEPTQEFGKTNYPKGHPARYCRMVSYNRNPGVPGGEVFHNQLKWTTEGMAYVINLCKEEVTRKQEAEAAAPK